jgi:hypothetical protein
MGCKIGSFGFAVVEARCGGYWEIPVKMGQKEPLFFYLITQALHLPDEQIKVSSLRTMVGVPYPQGKAAFQVRA